jgi:site-specific recombinase XerD
MALIKHIFSLAEKWEVIEKSPAMNISKLEENNIKERYLSDGETENLLRELKLCEHTVVPALIEFLILTGARKSEATNAKWSYMDIENAIWTVPLSKSGHSRQIILSQAAITILEKRKGLAKDNPYVFANSKTGLPITNFYMEWDKIRKNAGIPDVRIHDLRHNFASVLVNSGRSLYEVQILLGHADIKTTQRYAHLEKNTLKDAVNLISSRIYAGKNEGVKD